MVRVPKWPLLLVAPLLVVFFRLQDPSQASSPPQMVFSCTTKSQLVPADVMPQNVLLRFADTDRLRLFSAFRHFDEDRIVVILSSYGYYKRKVFCRSAPSSPSTQQLLGRRAERDQSPSSGLRVPGVHDQLSLQCRGQVHLDLTLGEADSEGRRG